MAKRIVNDLKTALNNLNIIPENIVRNNIDVPNAMLPEARLDQRKAGLTREDTVRIASTKVLNDVFSPIKLSEEKKYQFFDALNDLSDDPKLQQTVLIHHLKNYPDELKDALGYVKRTYQKDINHWMEGESVSKLEKLVGGLEKKLETRLDEKKQFLLDLKIKVDDPQWNRKGVSLFMKIPDGISDMRDDLNHISKNSKPQEIEEAFSKVRSVLESKQEDSVKRKSETQEFYDSNFKKLNDILDKGDPYNNNYKAPGQVEEQEVKPVLGY